MPTEAGTYGNGSSQMRALLSRYGSRRDLEPMVELAARSRALGAEVRVYEAPDFAEPLARVDVPLVATGVMPAGVRL
jgi:vancomycin aglycone glucosyltransferase